MNARQEKGWEIARTGRIEPYGKRWRVWSQSGNGDYIVDLRGKPSCACPDFDLSGMKCKHIYAVQYRLLEDDDLAEASPPPEPAPEPKPRKPTYKQAWSAYNVAQTNEKALFQYLLHDLCKDIPALPSKQGTSSGGRTRLPLSDMVFALVFKVYSTLSGRRFISDLHDARAKGYLDKVPHFNSISNYMEMEVLESLLRDLITRSALPLKVIETDFAVDSSGFSTCQYARWYDAKYGREMERREWLKAHLMTGVKTNVVTSVEISGKYANDSPYFEPLVEATAKHFNVQEVSADKAYLSATNLGVVHAKGATPFIPFKSNTTGEGDELWKQMYHYYTLNRENFLRHYHKRSNVESTFYMIKVKFGSDLRSKGEQAQKNELLCKVLCHNLCCVIQSIFELGIEIGFPDLPQPADLVAAD
jgi:transposase